MKFNYITIKQENGEELKFYPPSITDIKIGKGYVMIWENNEGIPKATHLAQPNYLYTKWAHFLNQINTFFDMEEEEK